MDTDPSTEKGLGCKLLLLYIKEDALAVASLSVCIYLFKYIVSQPDMERRHRRNPTYLNSHVAIDILTRCGHLGTT